PASYLGKVKTTIQLIAILLLSLKFILLGNIALWLSIVVAYISAYDYLRVFIKEKGWNL
ncbi:MAG: CDP-diacylglycerol--glycerol-3-phosphate 3-phosphatidyltransferase, partial [Aquificota bacterium]